MSEDKIQADIFLALTQQFPECRKGKLFAVPNGGARRGREARKMQATGSVSGVADLCFFHRGRIYFLEVKTPAGKQSPAQKAFEATCKEDGTPYTVVTSVGEAVVFIKNIIT